MEIPDYNYLSTDTVRPMSEMVGKWLNVQKGQLDVQKTQSEQVAGQLAQQAIDPITGQFDPAKFYTLLAKTPGAAFAAFPSMKDTSALRGANIDQNLSVNAHVNAAVTAALASDDDHIRQAVIEQAGRLRSILPPDQVDHALLGLRGDIPAELRRQLETVRVATLPPQQRQDWIHGTRPAVSAGGYTGFPTIPAPGRGDAPVVLHTLSPAEQNERVTIPDIRQKLPDGSPNPDFGRPKSFTRVEELEMNGFTVLPNGQVIRSGGGGAGGGGAGSLGSGRYGNVPPALRNNPQPAQNPQPAVPAAPAVPVPGGPGTYGGPGMGVLPAAPGPGASIGGSATVASANPAFAPSVGSAAPPSPAVAGDVSAIMAGMNQARATPQGGTQQAFNALQSGAVAPAAPAVPPVAAPPPAQRSPFDRPAVGASPAEQKLMEGAGPQFAAETNAGTQAQAQQAILGNMLVDTKQFLPGPWAETWKNIRARVAPVFGVNETALAGAENFDKAAAQLANAQGAGSDARMSVNVAANPHGGMSAPGVDLALRQLQGNADYLQARARMAQGWPAKADYNGFADSVRQLDPRVFQYERMTGPQRNDYLDALSPKDARAFMAAHKFSEDKNLFQSR